MILYGAPNPAPNPRRVRIFIAEKGLDLSETLVNMMKREHKSDEHRARNSLGQIPTLVLDDGTAISETVAICRYLDDQAQAGLYPASRLWDVLTLEATADGIMDAAVLIIYESRVRPEDHRFAPWVDGQWTKIDRSLDALEQRWLSHLHGPLDMGQIAVGVALGYLDFRHGDRDWRGGRPGLAAWDAVFAERPSMVATRPVA